MKAREYIMERLDRSIVVSDLAQYACVSERTLERSFRKETGLTPLQYITAHRLEAVRQAIITCSKTQAQDISTLAFGAGFNHMGRFSHRFRQQFGLLPSELRSLSRRPN